MGAVMFLGGMAPHSERTGAAISSDGRAVQWAGWHGGTPHPCPAVLSSPCLPPDSHIRDQRARVGDPALGWAGLAGARRPFIVRDVGDTGSGFGQPFWAPSERSQQPMGCALVGRAGWCKCTTVD